jgi:hypothetical protein
MDVLRDAAARPPERRAAIHSQVVSEIDASGDAVPCSEAHTIP